MKTASTKERLSVLNDVLVQLGKPTLKSWSKSRDALEARITQEQKLIKASTKKPRKTSIATICRDGFAGGLSNDQIHGILMERAAEVEYTEAKKWYIAWYRAAERRKSKAA